MDSFITVKHLGEFEFEDRRSIFIGYAIPIKCENDAIDFIASVKKKYPDARHWVYAYVLSDLPMTASRKVRRVCRFSIL